jgi:hypothetical protein
MRLTDPTYISQQMFDKAIREKFQDNPDDTTVRQQAITLLKLHHDGQWGPQTIADIMHAAKVFGRTSKEEIADIGFCMGLQFGFELGITYPPLSRTK